MTNFMLILLLVLVLVIELEVRDQRSDRVKALLTRRSQVSFPLVELQLGEKAKQSRAVPQFLIS